MPQADQMLGTYLHLARASALRRRPMVRDKLLVLAGVIAAELGMSDVAASCRAKVLAHNPRHLVRRWPTLAEALADERFEPYLKQLRRRYTPEKAEHMLSSLGIELARERALYLSDEEYAAALLETTPDAALPSEDVDRISAIMAPSRQLPRGARYSREMLLTWAPYAAGVVTLGALAALWRAASR